MKEKLAFAALLVLSIVLVAGGFEGSIGRLLACLLVPREVVDNVANSFTPNEGT